MKTLAEVLQERLKSQSLPDQADDGTCYCEGIGIIGTKTPDNYPMAEVRFCSCEKGQQQKLLWERKNSYVKPFDLEAAMNAAELPTHYRKHRIDSPRWVNDNQYAVLYAKEYAANGYVTGKTGVRNSICLFGEFGVSKTSLLSAVMVERMKAGVSCLFVKAQAIIDEVQASYKSATVSKLSVLQRYQKIPFLLIDEFGYAFDGELTKDKIGIMTEVLSYRYDWELPTAISSNLSPERMKDLLTSQQIVDRILETYAVARMTGDNLRYSWLDAMKESK